MPNEDKQFDALPDAIIDALRDLDGPAVLPDANRDADLLSGARQHLATSGLSRKRRNLRLFFAGSTGGAIAAAAMIAFVVFIGNPVSEPQADQEFAAATSPNSSQQTAERKGDIDQNGTIDILDAYALAKAQQRGEGDPQYDLNNDGQVNQRDIDFLANQAVALNTGEQS
ncbi:MAG: dockerin type I domain-containing protein [Phycisphaeraceae bacterium]